MSRETSRKEGVFAKGQVPPVAGMAAAVPSISLPISRLLNDVDEFPKFSHRRQPSGTENPAADGFDVDQVYAAESDPFCQLKATGFDIPLLAPDRQPNRAVSIARSSSGTTDTSATSVSGKIDPEHDRDGKDIQQTTITPSILVSQSQSQPEPEQESEPKLPRCVPLHGTLASLECSRCSYSEPLHSALPLPGEMLPCPSCEGEQDERIESSQRPRSIGFLRASVLLYGEEHRHGDSIGAVVERDLIGRLKDDRMDLLIVAGTTLQIPGVKRMIKEFAKALRTQPLAKKKAPRKSGATGDVDEKDAAADDEESEDFPIRTILLNRDPPSKGKGGEWANTFDVWVQGDLQEFVRDWVVDGPSPEEMKLPPKAEVLSVIPPNTQRKMEVTKVEGTKISLSLGKVASATRQPAQTKRKEPPSPDKSVKGKAKSRAKNPKLGSGIPFPSRKPNIKSPPRKPLPPKSQPALDSPEFHSGSSDVCVFVPYPPMAATFVASRSPLLKTDKSRGKAKQTGKQAAQKAVSLVPSTPTPKPKPAARPLKPRTAPTRRSTRQANVIQPVTAQSTLPPVTPRKRNFASTCSSPLTSVPSSDDEAEDCSSQGMIEDALDVTA
jgi:NAD-dependent SIR2 family protein deacetylase